MLLADMYTCNNGHIGITSMWFSSIILQEQVKMSCYEEHPIVDGSTSSLAQVCRF